MVDVKGGETQATAGYILGLYQSIETLNDVIADYIDLVVSMNAKYGENSEAKMTDKEKEALRNIVYLIRRAVFKIDIKLRALASKIESIKIPKKLENLTKKLIEAPVYDFKDLQDYALEVNRIFVEGIGYDVLEKLGDIYQTYMSAFAGVGGGGIEEVQT